MFEFLFKPRRNTRPPCSCGGNDSQYKLSEADEHELTDTLTCQICLKIMDDPIALRCGHAFCKVCMHTWFQRSRTCPTCGYKRCTPNAKHTQLMKMLVRSHKHQNHIIHVLNKNKQG